MASSSVLSRNFLVLSEPPRSMVSRNFWKSVKGEVFVQIDVWGYLVTKKFHGIQLRIGQRSQCVFVILSWSFFNHFLLKTLLGYDSQFIALWRVVWLIFCFRIACFYYFEQWWLISIVSQLCVLNKSLYAVWYKCAVSRSQPCISRYYRPCGSFYIFATGGCYAGSLPLLGSCLSISHWRTRT